jgi:UDP-glucose 4-epimerase
VTAPTRAVVLGGTGFIGAHVAREFASAGLDVRALGTVDFDLADPAAVDRLEPLLGPGTVLFFASVIPPRLGRDRATMLRNVAMGDHVCRALERVACNALVYMSTDNVYAADEEMLSEATRLDPVDLYGLGHLVRERTLGDAARSCGTPYLVLRTGPVYGPGDRNDSYGPGRFLRTAVRDGVITLAGGGEEVRHHLFVGDLARAARELVAAATGVVHVAPQAGWTFREVADRVRELVGGHVRIDQQPRQVPLRHRRHVPGRLATLLPGFTWTPLEAGLSRTLSVLREAGAA